MKTKLLMALFFVLSVTLFAESGNMGNMQQKEMSNKNETKGIKNREENEKNGMKMFQSVPKEKAEIIQESVYCPNCGMYLPKFYKTNHAALFKNGEVRQYCSIYCLVEDTEFGDRKGEKDNITKVYVVDVPSLKLIDAKSAYYVVGSKKKGTMSMTSKYAFKDKKEAEEFAKKNGGEVMNFEKTYNVAKSDFIKDTAFVIKKGDTKMYKKGKMMYENQCNKRRLENIHAHNYGSLKAIIANSKVCGEKLNDMELQAITLYYWDLKMENLKKRYGANKELESAIKNIKE